MAKKESPMEGLARFMPPGTFEQVAPYFEKYTIHLTITRHRRSLHGDYRAPTRQLPAHRISVNATLNPYSFLITLLHELAHLTTTVQYGLKPAPHGKEWKGEFQRVLLPFVGKKIFPPDVERALQAYLGNPAASTCTDPRLFKALSRYDDAEEGRMHADEVQVGQEFELGGRRFIKLEQLRTRSRCKDLVNGRVYFVQGIALVKLLEK
jgi:SprT protein